MFGIFWVIFTKNIKNRVAKLAAINCCLISSSLRDTLHFNNQFPLVAPTKPSVVLIREDQLCENIPAVSAAIFAHVPTLPIIDGACLWMIRLTCGSAGGQALAAFCNHPSLGRRRSQRACQTSPSNSCCGIACSYDAISVSGWR